MLHYRACSTWREGFLSQFQEGCVLLLEAQNTKSIAKFIPFAFAVKHLIVALALKDYTLQVGMVNPNDSVYINDLEFITEKIIVPIQLSQEELDSRLCEIYGDIEVVSEVRDQKSDIRDPNSDETLMIVRVGPDFCL